MKGWLLRNPGKMDDPSIVKIMKVVAENKIDLTVVDPLKIHVICDHDFAGKIYVGNEVMDVPDYVVAAFFTEKNYHTAAVLRMLESVGVLCINSYDCIKNVDDKLLTFQKVAESIENINFPKTLLVTEETNASFVSQLFDYPLVMKVMHGSKGKGVVLVNTEKELDNLISMMTASEVGDEIIIQECIAASKGRDLRVVLCNGKYDNAFVRENEKSFRSNLAKGGKIIRYSPPASVMEAAEKIAELLKINMGSVDFLFGENDTFYLCEANAMPGISFDLHEMFKNLMEQVKNKPEPLWKKRLRDEERTC
ncbi:MAG TPA: ATP-grasp domain-containing protein [Acetobacterium sp.]